MDGKVEWRPIPGFESTYEVSSEGHVRRASTGRWLRGYQERNGYLRVALMTASGKSRHFVHTLVALAFIGAKSSGQQVNHRNGVKTDNALGNIEYCTRSQNMRHAIANGLRQSRRGQPLRKLSIAEARQVLSLRGKETVYATASKFGVSYANVLAIWNRRTWKYLDSVN